VIVFEAGTMHELVAGPFRDIAEHIASAPRKEWPKWPASAGRLWFWRCIRVTGNDRGFDRGACSGLQAAASVSHRFPASPTTLSE